MTDRELLEAAAKAARLREFSCINGKYAVRTRDNGLQDWDLWNPLNADADALRLAIVLRLDIVWTRDVRDRVVAMLPGNVAWGENSADDPLAATRRAIVRAAAEIGRAKP